MWYEGNGSDFYNMKCEIFFSFCHIKKNVLDFNDHINISIKI